jgi:hypothetical protein
VRHRYHLIVEHRESGDILAWRHRVGWLLPHVAAAARQRPSEIIGRTIRLSDGYGLIRYITGGTIDPAISEVNWLCVIDAEQVASHHDLTWCAPDTLDGTPLVPYQRAALDRYRQGRSSGRRGPFEDRHWPDQVRHWVAEATGGTAGSVRFAKQYRASPHDTVAALDTDAGRMFFKGSASMPFREACVSMALAEAVPTHFAETVAYDSDRGWWLTRGLPGRWPGRDRAEYFAVVDALVAVQRNLLGQHSWRAAPGVRTESVAELSERILEEASRLSSARLDPVRASVSPTTRAALATELRQASDALEALCPPMTWIHTDLAPVNVLLSPDSVHFIDLGEAWLGPAAAAIEFFIEQFTGPNAPDGQTVAALRRHYVEQWSDLYDAREMEATRESVSLFVPVIRAVYGIDRVRALTQNEDLVDAAEHCRHAAIGTVVQRLCPVTVLPDVEHVLPI